MSILELGRMPDKKTEEAYENAIGKIIKEATMSSFCGEDTLKILFTDETCITIMDGGQCCCEARCMSTDDDLSYLAGKTLLDIEVKDAPCIEDDNDVHEVQFLEIKTNDYTATFANHNEHNGYYGGFCIEIREFPARPTESKEKGK